jgi:MFS family permease
MSASQQSVRSSSDSPANDNTAPANDVAAPAAPRLLTRGFARLLAMQAAFGIAFSIFMLLPKVLAADLGGSARAIGLVMGAFGVGSLLAIPFVGRVVARLGERRALVLANLILAAGALGFTLVRSVGPAAVALRGLHGVAWSLSFAAGLALVAELTPPARLAQAVGLYGAASLAMNAIGPALAEPLGERFGYRAMFLLAVVAASVGAWLAAGLAELRRDGGAAAPPAHAREQQPAGRGPVYLVLGVSGLAFSVMFTFLAPFALARGVRAVSPFFVAYTIAALAVRVLAARLADRLGHRRVALTSTAAYGVAVISAGVCGPAHLGLVGAAFGAAHGALFPALMALVLGDATASERARAVALANGAMNVGMTAVFVVGLGVARLGYPALFVAAGALTVAAAGALRARRA